MKTVLRGVAYVGVILSCMLLYGCLSTNGHHQSGDYDWHHYDGNNSYPQAAYRGGGGDRHRRPGGARYFPFPKEASADEPRVHGMAESEWLSLTPEQQKAIAADKANEKPMDALPQS